MSSTITLTSILALLPELALLVLASAVLFYDRAVKPDERRRIGLLAAWGGVATLLLTVGLWVFLNEPNTTPELVWGGMIRHDLVTLVFRVMFIIAVIITSLISVDVKRLQHGEYYALLLAATIGFDLMAASADLIMLFVAFETASVSLYVLAGFAQADGSEESGMKYFIYGSFASAMMLYGMSLIYGLTGVTGFYDVAAAITTAPDGTVLLAAVLLIFGFGYKISAVPFHFWAPDVYEGAPTPVTGFVSTASKAAGFAIFIRLFTAGVVGSQGNSQEWWAMLVAMSIVTMTLGNFLAIHQKNIKRLLAYSSIAQAGYVMIALVVALTPHTPDADGFSPAQDGAGAAMFFLLYYVVTNIAAFGVIVLLSNVTNSEKLSDLSGLSRRSPMLGLALLFALLSLGGIPPTGGFFAKFFIFKAAVDAGYWGLALIGILNAFIGLYYYLSIVKYAYLYRSDEEDVAIPISRAAKVALAITVFGILYLGVLAGPAFEWTRTAAGAFFGS